MGDKRQTHGYRDGDQAAILQLKQAWAVTAERDRVLADERAVLASREAVLASTEDDIVKLRAGLAYAEKLAFERAAELERIQSFWWWRARSYLMKRFVPGSRKARGAS